MDSQISKRHRSVAVYVLTFFFAVIEWLMFELIRMPYRPPNDMLTFLGTEKYGVVILMVMVGLAWLAFVSYRVCHRVFNGRECLEFFAFTTVLASLLSYVVFFPSWPVTPFELLWQ